MTPRNGDSMVVEVNGHPSATGVVARLAGRSGFPRAALQTAKASCLGIARAAARRPDRVELPAMIAASGDRSRGS